MKVTKPLFEHKDDKGEFKHICTGDWKDMNYAFRKRGTWSADHYHQHTTELFYTVYGDCIFEITDVKTGKVTKTRIRKNEIFIVDPYENVKIQYHEDTLFIMLKDSVYKENNPDIHKMKK